MLKEISAQCHSRREGAFMDTFTLLVTVFLLILVLGMQIQISDMTKKIDDLLGTKPKPGQKSK
jgi:preprotein translocase subunit SecG